MDEIERLKDQVAEKNVSLEKLMKENAEESKKGAAAYDKYACFCKEQADNKIYGIEKFNETIEVLAA